jgi:hypothetical protein
MTDQFDHYRWHMDGQQLTWKQTLEAMCVNYGSFSGRWHSNEFWGKTKDQLPGMTEEQCRSKVIQTEREADAELAHWRATQ